jgi:hypothetical protein
MILNERIKNLQTNKDLVEEEKRILLENQNKAEDKLKRVLAEANIH